MCEKGRKKTYLLFGIYCMNMPSVLILWIAVNIACANGWEVLLVFNDYNEGMLEIIMIYITTCLYVIGAGIFFKLLR